MSAGRGGVTAVSTATGIARSTINRGAELKAACIEPVGRIRRPGGGRKRAVDHQPGLLPALEALIEAAIRGDPETPLRWVSRSQRNIAEGIPKGVVVTDAEMAAINLEFDPFHGDWNYTIRPTEKPH